MSQCTWWRLRVLDGSLLLLGSQWESSHWRRGHLFVIWYMIVVLAWGGFRSFALQKIILYPACANRTWAVMFDLQKMTLMNHFFFNESVKTIHKKKALNLWVSLERLTYSMNYSKQLPRSTVIGIDHLTFTSFFDMNQIV